MDSATGGPGVHGWFVAFEGGDGAGKSTQLAMLVARLRAGGHVDAPGRPKLVVTREPGGTELGAQIRQMLLSGGDVAPAAEALLYAADRAQHVATVLRPALARGDWVISDRYLDSSIAYQAEGRGLDEAAIRRINAVATGGLAPELTIVLDIDVTTATARRQGEGDRMEQAGEAFHAKVNRRFRELAAAAPRRYAVVAADGGTTEVHARVWAAFAPLLAGQSPGRSCDPGREGP
jgi:dTMP kinase